MPTGYLAGLDPPTPMPRPLQITQQITEGTNMNATTAEAIRAVRRAAGHEQACK
jgi:hypothetical protein